MPTRSWIIAFALVVTFTGSLQAQQETHPSQDWAGEEHQPAENLPPEISVRVIEDDEAAEARQRREEEADQREVEDLIAQQRMADATEAMNEATQSMERAAWWSVSIVGVGTILLVWTLFLTRSANRAAQEAVSVTQRIGEAQVRAYLGIVDVKVRKFATRQTPAYSFAIQNSGQSPAKIIRFCVGMRASDAAETAVFREMIKKQGPDITAGNYLPTDENFKSKLTDEWYEAVMSSRKVVTIGGYVIYRCVFGKTRRLVFRYVMDPRTVVGEDVMMALADKNNRSS